MARGGLDFEGIRYSGVTYKANSALVSAVLAARGWENDGRSAVLDKAVTITGNGEVGFGSAGDVLLGRIQQYEFDGYVTVQDTGYTELPGVSGNLPNPGDFVVVNGSGAVIASVGAVGPARAVSIDSENFKVMVLLG